MTTRFFLDPLNLLPVDEEGKPISPDGYVIKLSKNLKPFVSRVTRTGKSQKVFAERYGKPVGNCVKANVREGMSGAEIHDIVRKCSRNPDYRY